MRIAIIGAGVVGVTLAWELVRDGHQVTVFDRHDSVAAEASFAPAGIVGAGAFAPAAWPGLPGPTFKAALDREASFHLASKADVTALGWLRRWRQAAESVPTSALLTLAPLLAYGRERFLAALAEEQLELERSSGALVLLQTEDDLAAARPWVRQLAEQGVKLSLLDEARCRAREPGLNPETTLRAGVLLPELESANARQFTHQLRGAAQRRGVDFRFRSQVTALLPGAQPEVVFEPATEAEGVSGFDGTASRGGARPSPSAGSERFDQVAVCAAIGSADLLRRHGLRLPLAPVWGASLTAPIRHLEAHPDVGPKATVIDARSGASVSRFGQRLRVGAGGLLTGPTRRPDADDEKRFDQRLYGALDSWFPGLVEAAKMQRWTGARPSLPDGLPVIGPGPAPGLWMNLGHGGFGLALAGACARLLADAIGGRTPALPLEGFGIERLR